MAYLTSLDKKKRKKAQLTGAAVTVISVMMVLILGVVITSSFIQSIDEGNMTLEAKAAKEKVESHTWTGFTLLAIGILVLVMVAIFGYIALLR